MFPFLYGQTPTFFLMISVAVMAATFHAYWIAPKRNLSQVAILDMSMAGTLGGFIGARLVHVFVEAPAYYAADWVRIFYIWQGGFVGYGAFIGATLAIFLYAKIRHLNFLDYADVWGLSCPWVIFFIRIGCLGAGCCYGKPTDSWLHLVFTNPHSDAGSKFNGIPLHPTQLYDMANALFVYVLVSWRAYSQKFKGELLLTFFAGYAFFRFWIEFLRGDADRGVYFNQTISTSQLISIGILVLVAVLLMIFRKDPKVLMREGEDE